MNEMPKIEEGPLATMRQRATPNTKWAAYQNVAMDSSLCGQVQFLMFGEGCTHTTRPEKMPDTPFDLGWKYKFIGLVNLDAGIIEAPDEDCGEIAKEI